ncbi:hypothetical protein GWI33_005728 [Rhynchophorus ferrugineus]|uniref:Uncharacterized protein n=1 Tax=Rhynchophorus ferrugineus TaxID=354439 RepID=A0A834IJK4_RHYFE|nr:hypothetical protein GWI33_005728 [Rhynchophorus ferrugineus]
MHDRVYQQKVGKEAGFLKYADGNDTQVPSETHLANHNKFRRLSGRNAAHNDNFGFQASPKTQQDVQDSFLNESIKYNRLLVVDSRHYINALRGAES